MNGNDAESLAIAGASAAPPRALAAMEALSAARATRGWRPAPPRELSLLATIASASDALARSLIGEPALLSALAAPGVLDRPSTSLGPALGRRLSRLAPDELAQAERTLRRARRRELCRLAAREITGRVDILQSAAELSDLAATVIGAGLGFVERRSPGGFCVLALGKLGGRELNFSSDVDLLFVYRGDGEDGGTTRREQFTRLAERLVRLLGEQTADGFCFRVDLNLRPEGRNGPLVNPLDAILGYYESYGRSWERLALLRARPIAGDLALGEELLGALAPFVYRRSIDFGVLDELRELKRRIEAEAARRGDDVKVGPGGIREIEFFAQSLALLHGGQRPALRQGGLVPLLERLGTEGLLPARDRQALADAYRFLRRVEHRLQMLDDRQTHLLPPRPEDRRLLARRLGYAGADPLAELTRDLAAHRDVASRAFAALLRAPRSISAFPPAPHDAAIAADAAEAEATRVEALDRLGFHGPAEALAELHRLSRPRAPFGSGGAFATRLALPALLSELSRAPDPDRALGHFADWACTLRAPEAYLGALARDPAALRRLANLFGASELLSRELLRHPELIDAVLPSGAFPSHKTAAQMEAELSERTGGGDLEASLQAACRYRNEEILRIGLSDLAGELPIDEVSIQLSSLALAVVRRVLGLAANEIEAELGAPAAGTRLCVLALGSLGGAELSYGSDLDLVFLYSAGGESSGGRLGRRDHREYFARLAQRLIALLGTPVREGFLYRIDTRLRPSGNQGALVTSLPAFRDYHAAHSRLWERQALIKASFAAGDRALFEQARAEVIEPAVWRGEAEPAPLRAEIDRLRRRMEGELPSRGRNPKLDRGGLVDVDFTVQTLQLLHGGKETALREPGTLPALAALSEAGALPSRDAESLADAARFLRRIDARLRIGYDVRQEVLPMSTLALDRFARGLGFAAEGTLGAGERLLAEYARQTAAVRVLYDRSVHGAG